MEETNGQLLTNKIDQYVELVSKLDDKVADLEFQIEQLNKQLTQMEEYANQFKQWNTKK